MGTVIFMENHRPTCSVPGCASPVQTLKSGLCIMHNARMKKHGSTDNPRPAGFGEKRGHSLWMRWTLLKRRKVLCPEWVDFWAFAKGVSPQPEDSKKLARPDESRPFGPDNFVWAKTPSREETLAYHRAYSQANPLKRRNKHLKDKFGIDDDIYQQMFRRQHGLCAICGEPEKASRRNRTNGEKRHMAVDHCHRTDKVRDLLCTNCNTALGALDDRIDLFEKAIAYVKRWRVIHAEEDAA